MTLNHPADECADSTADDRAFAEHRADFTANGRADSIANDRSDSTADDRADSNMGDGGLSNATRDVAEVGLVAKTLLGNDLNDALRKQTLTLGQLRSAVAVNREALHNRITPQGGRSDYGSAEGGVHREAPSRDGAAGRGHGDGLAGGERRDVRRAGEQQPRNGRRTARAEGGVDKRAARRP